MAGAKHSQAMFFQARAGEKIRNKVRQKALQKAKPLFVGKRAKAMAALPEDGFEFEALRSACVDIRNRNRAVAHQRQRDVKNNVVGLAQRGLVHDAGFAQQRANGHIQNERGDDAKGEEQVFHIGFLRASRQCFWPAKRDNVSIIP